MQTTAAPFTGTDSGPPSTQAYKRAVYKQPPRNFTVQVLPVQKHGTSYSYGMLITPLKDNDRRSIYSGHSSESGSSGHRSMYLSRSSLSPVSPTFSTAPSVTSTLLSIPDDATTAPLDSAYEVWRRWEDCLYFQDTLETQYGLMAREKRNRLAAGKGVKKNGYYARDDPNPERRLHRAASFESLPPGPDPHSIAKDVHAPGLLPRLTKKATLFRASKETIETRANEFEALIEALLREDDNVPTLVMELRGMREVRDFFGFWRRDHDRLVKQTAELDRSTTGRRSTDSMTSRASSIFSSTIGGSGSGIYFSASNISLQLPSPNVVPSEPTRGAKGPRKPAFMQGNSLVPPLSPVSPRNSDGSISSGGSRRPRAQTLEGPSATNGIRSAAYATRGGSLDIPGRGKLPVSAPAGSTFSSNGSTLSYRESSHSRVAAGSGSDEGDSDASTSDRVFSSPASPPRPLPGGIPTTPEKKTKGRESVHGPIIVSLQEGETLSLFGDDGGFDFADMGPTHLIPREGARGLQDLTIREEDESDTETEGEHSGHSDESAAAYWAERRGVQASRVNAMSNVQSRSARGGRRTAGFSSRPAEFDARSVASAATTDSGSSSGFGGTKTPLSNARAAAAHADALRALTGGRQSSPAPSGPRDVARDNIVSYASDASNGGSGLQFAISRESGAPIILQPPVVVDEDADEKAFYTHGFDDREDIAHQKRFHSRESMASVRTFMTTDSANAIIPFPLSMKEGRKSSLGRAALGMSIPRPISANSTLTHRMSQMTVRDGGDDLLDTYFSDMSGPNDLDANSPGREHVRGSLARCDSFPKQFHLPWALSRRPSSPGLPVSARNSVMSTETTFSIPPPTPNLVKNAHVARQYVEYGPPRSPTYPESICSARTDDSFSTSGLSPISPIGSGTNGMGTLSIKAVWNDTIVAFRIDRSSPLASIRKKISEKLLASIDESVPTPAPELPENFVLGFKPPAAGRVQTLKNGFGGRTRSSSVSSQVAPNALKVMFSEKDWDEAVRTCAPGAKVTLHVLNG